MEQLWHRRCGYEASGSAHACGIGWSTEAHTLGGPILKVKCLPIGIACPDFSKHRQHSANFWGIAGMTFGLLACPRVLLAQVDCQAIPKLARLTPQAPSRAPSRIKHSLFLVADWRELGACTGAVGKRYVQHQPALPCLCS